MSPSGFLLLPTRVAALAALAVGLLVMGLVMKSCNAEAIADLQVATAKTGERVALLALGRAEHRADSLEALAHVADSVAREDSVRSDSLRRETKALREAVLKERKRFTVAANDTSAGAELRRRGLDPREWVMARWDTIPFAMPVMAAIATMRMDTAIRVQAQTIELQLREIASARASARRWQGAAESRQAALDSAHVALAAKDSTIARLERQRPGKWKRVWEAVDEKAALLLVLLVAL